MHITLQGPQHTYTQGVDVTVCICFFPTCKDYLVILGILPHFAQKCQSQLEIHISDEAGRLRVAGTVLTEPLDLEVSLDYLLYIRLLINLSDVVHFLVPWVYHLAQDKRR